MCEAVDFFGQALSEQGLDAKVAHESDEFNDTFYVSKNVNGETMTFTTSIDNNYLGKYTEEKRIAIAARGVVDKFEEKLTESFEWQGRRIEVMPYDEPEGRCANCGTVVELPSEPTLFPDSAELSAPQPTPVEEQTVLDSLNDHSRVVLKMYLIGKLREKCEQYCPNSKYNSTESFI
jgi:hypothetical protein